MGENGKLLTRHKREHAHVTKSSTYTHVHVITWHMHTYTRVHVIIHVANVELQNPPKKN